MSADDPLARALGFLPHGTEFRFLDRLTSLNPGQSGEGEYQLRGDESFLRGHFPGEPLMPGVLLIEAAAQLAGVVAQSDPAIPPLTGLKLTAVRNAKITGTARVSEAIILQAEIIKRLGNLIQAHARARVGGQIVLAVELTLCGSVSPSNASPEQDLVDHLRRFKGVEIPERKHVAPPVLSNGGKSV